MLSLRSHVIESSFAGWSAWSPPGNFVRGHSLTICDIVCLLPQAHSGSSLLCPIHAEKQHRYRDQHDIGWVYSPDPSLEIEPRLSRGWYQLLRTGWGISCLARSSFQASCADQTELGIEDHIGCLDYSRSSGWPKYHPILVGWGEVGLGLRV